MSSEDAHNRRTKLGARIANLARLREEERTSAKSYLIVVFVLLVVTALLVSVRSQAGIVNIAMIYLLCVFLTALWAGRGAAVVMAAGAFLLLDFFFFPPYKTFTIARSDHVLAIVVFLTIALATSQLVDMIRDRVRMAEQQKARAELLYQLNEGLVADRSLDEILNTIVGHVVQIYGAAQANILTRNESGRLARVAGYPAFQVGLLARNEEAVAMQAVESGQTTGMSTGRARVRRPHGIGVPNLPVVKPNEDVLYLPIDTPERQIGVLEVRGRPAGGRFDEEDRALLGSLADQAALALERVRLTNEAARADVLAQSNELKSALLASVSHDLRTPLATIKTSVSSLLDPEIVWEQEARMEFLEAIDEETDRLTRMVGNLLDLSRIEGGALRPDRDWHDARDLMQSVVRRLSARAAATGHVVSVALDSNVTLGFFDYIEIDQVLANLVENAIKYTPAGTNIVVEATTISEGLQFAVRDNGPGIPATARERVFEKFYRATNAERLQGTGIGLTISRGLVEAHGGRIWIEGTPGGGASVVFTIPFDRSSLHEQLPQ